jgi:hypothetical protein
LTPIYQANTQTFQANTQTFQPNTQTFQANTQTFQANTQTFQANAQTYQANQQTFQANAQTYQANPQTYQANPQYQQPPQMSPIVARSFPVENIFAVAEPKKPEPVKVSALPATTDQLSSFVNVIKDCYQVRLSNNDIPNFINSSSTFDGSSSQRSSRIFKRQNHSLSSSNDQHQNPDALCILKTKMFSVDDPRFVKSSS